MSQGTELRIVMDEHFELTKQQAVAHLAGLPEDSWWVGLSREAFYAKVPDEHERMAGSKFGRMLGRPSIEDAA